MVTLDLSSWSIWVNSILESLEYVSNSLTPFTYFLSPIDSLDCNSFQVIFLRKSNVTPILPPFVPIMPWAIFFLEHIHPHLSPSLFHKGFQKVCSKISIRKDLQPWKYLCASRHWKQLLVERCFLKICYSSFQQKDFTWQEYHCF